MLKKANDRDLGHRGEYAYADRRVIEATFVTGQVGSI